MTYFPHDKEEEFENPRLNRFGDNYAVSRSRNYSPDDKDKITQRIIRYFEDPKEAKALAEIKKLSNKSKKSSKDVRSSFGNFIGTDNLKNNTELNRVMFKKEGGDYQLEQPNARDPFKRRKFKFSTQRYVPKNKNMTLIDEIRIKQNENNKDEENAQYKRKKDNRIIRFSVDNGIDNDILEAKKKNNNYNSNTSTLTNNHVSNFRRYKKLKSENITRPRFRERKQEIKPKNDDDQQKIEIMEGSYNTIPEEYKAKNNATVENLHNKEQIVINEYHTKGKYAPKNYKTEYVWDKSINRLVEKRIYLDKNDINSNNNNNEDRKYNNNSVNYRNRYKRLDDENDDNRKKKDKRYEDEDKEEKRKVNLKYNINRKYKNYDANENKNKNQNENEDNKIEVRKRFGNSAVILKKDNKPKKKNEEKERDINQNQNNVNKGNRFYRRYRNYKTENKEEEKPKKEEIIIEKTTVIEKVESPNKYETPEKEKDSSSAKPRRIYKKRPNNIIINDGKDETEKNYEKNLTEANPKAEHKYNKRPYNQPTEPLSKTIYTKKKISEEIPKKEVPSEKKFERIDEKYEEKKPVKVEVEVEVKEEPKKRFEKKVPKVNPYSKYKKKNMRIKTLQDDLDDEIEDKKPKVYNTAYNNYIKNKRKADDKKAHRARTTSELIDDLEKIENYNVNTYLKDDLLEIYDNINEQCNDFKNDIFYTNINSFEVNVGEFDKYKIPFLKKKTNAEDLCRGRVTSEDIYRKYSQNAKKYEKKRLYE